MKRNTCPGCTLSPTGICDKHGSRDGSRTETIVVRCDSALKRVLKARAWIRGMSEGRCAEELMRSALAGEKRR